MQIKHGHKVTLHLRFELPDGTEALSTFDEEPLELVLGDDTLREGFELALIGLKPGEIQTILIDPELGYGLHDKVLVHQMPLEQFPSEMQLAVGQIIDFTLAGGEEALGAITAIDKQHATVDFNHPLAGKPIKFTAEILSVEEAENPD